jgi:hypothetical protein
MSTTPTTTFIPGEYGHTVMQGPPLPPEKDWQAENAARMKARLDSAAIVARYQLTDALEIDTHLKAFGFPAALGYLSRVKWYENGGVSADARTVYDNVKVAEWEASILQLADTIRKSR